MMSERHPVVGDINALDTGVRTDLVRSGGSSNLLGYQSGVTYYQVFEPSEEHTTNDLKTELVLLIEAAGYTPQGPLGVGDYCFEIEHSAGLFDGVIVRDDTFDDSKVVVSLNSGPTCI